MAAGFKTATVASGDVPATQTDFPAYVDLTRMNGGTALSLAEAQSIRVYADSGKTTEWAREIVSATEMHVKIPSLTSTTSIYVDWDGVRADYAAGDTYGRNAVWSGYIATYHLENASIDSKGSNDLTNTNVTYTTGEIGDGALYNSSSDYLRTASDSNFNFAVGDAFSISGWVYLNATTGNQVLFSHQLNDATSRGYAAFLTVKDIELKVWDSVSGGKYFGRYTNADLLAVSTWHYLTFTYSGSGANTGIKLYVNATNNAGTGYSAGTVTTITNTGGATLGNTNTGGTNYNFDGIIDEARIIKSELSANWITTEYNNQSDEAGFWGTWSTAVGTNMTNFFALMA